MSVSVWVRECANVRVCEMCEVKGCVFVSVRVRVRESVCVDTGASLIAIPDVQVAAQVPVIE